MRERQDSGGSPCPDRRLSRYFSVFPGIACVLGCTLTSPFWRGSRPEEAKLVFGPVVTAPPLPLILKSTCRPFLILASLWLRSPAPIYIPSPSLLEEGQATQMILMFTALPATELLFPRGRGVLIDKEPS